MSDKKVTIEGLSRMIARGFSSVENKMATKAQLEGVERRLTGVEGRLANVERKLDNVEKLILKQHSEKINNLERRLVRLEEMFAVK